MRAQDFRNSTWTFVFWIMTLASGGVFVLSQAVPVPLPFLNDRTFFVAVVELALGFIFLGWPLLLPASLRDCRTPREGLLNVMLQVLVMTLFAFPVLVVAQGVSEVPPAAFAAGCGLVLGSAALVGAIWIFARTGGVEPAPWYFLALFVTQAMLPYLAYLALEIGDRDAFAFARTFSPFLSALRIHSDGLAAGHAAAFLAVAVGLGAAVHFRERRAAPTARGG